MSDDIVTKLREAGLCSWNTQQEAAYEIERLRYELELAIKWRDNYKLEIENLHERLSKETS